jgi:hypothetical protein
VSVTLTVKNVEYARISWQANLLFAFENVLKNAIAAAAGNGVMPSNVVLMLSPGSVTVQVTIMQLGPMQASFIRQRICSSTISWKATATNVAAISGIQAVSTGPIEVWPIHCPDWSRWEPDELDLVGFNDTTINGRYNKSETVHINGRSTYWNLQGGLLLYWCQQYDDWRVINSVWSSQECGGVAAAPAGQDIMVAWNGSRWIGHCGLGWVEWDGFRWQRGCKFSRPFLHSRYAEPTSVTLWGFDHTAVNGQYVRYDTALVADRPIYWNGPTGAIMYYCEKHGDWRVIFSMKRARLCAGSAAAPAGQDLGDRSLKYGWMEWSGTVWAYRPGAGMVAQFGGSDQRGEATTEWPELPPGG